MSAQSPSDVKALQNRAKELLDGLNTQSNTFEKSDEKTSDKAETSATDDLIH